jgi:hypothetical protein
MHNTRKEWRYLLQNTLCVFMRNTHATTCTPSSKNFFEQKKKQQKTLQIYAQSS